MNSYQAGPREPLRAEARAGFVLATILWVVLSAVLAFGHHLVVGQSPTVLGGGQGQVPRAFLAWLPHSALGYLLLITIGIDVFIDFRNVKMNHHRVWWSLAVLVLFVVVLSVLEAVETRLCVPIALIELMVCLPLKYFSLREYKW
jgi:hypothetical protein